MASGSRLADISRASWRKVARVCEGAAVFLDETAGELLHWAGGLQLLGQCVGCYDLYKDLNAVARDFIAEVLICTYRCTHMGATELYGPPLIYMAPRFLIRNKLVYI